MREIKFRAKYKDSVGWAFSNPKRMSVFWQDEENDFYIPETVTQYTGLKDKNGKEIFEGDIMQWCNTTNVWQKWIVKSCNGGWNPFISDMTTDKPFRYEVIGNIYENPDLL